MGMKKFINDPKNLTQELLEGLALSNPSRLTLTENKLVVSTSLGDKKRVHIVTLGGTGHEPAISGFVGPRNGRHKRTRRHFRSTRTSGMYRSIKDG